MGPEAQAQLSARGVEHPHDSSLPRCSQCSGSWPATCEDHCTEGPWRPGRTLTQTQKDGFLSLYLHYLLSCLESSMSPSAYPAHLLPSSYTYELSTRLGHLMLCDQGYGTPITRCSILYDRSHRENHGGFGGPNRMASLEAGGLSPSLKRAHAPCVLTERQPQDCRALLLMPPEVPEHLEQHLE